MVKKNKQPKNLRKTPKTGKRGGSIDEAAAFAFYCEQREDGRRVTYEQVAKKFRCSEKHIGVIAKKGGWVAKRKNLENIAIQKTTETLGEMLARKNEEHLKKFEEIANMGFDILKKEKAAYDRLIELQDRYAKKNKLSKKDLNKLTAQRKLAASRVQVAKEMAVDGIKGARVAMGLPTDVTKTMAMNFNATAELPRDELEKMQNALDKNYNKRIKR